MDEMKQMGSALAGFAKKALIVGAVIVAVMLTALLLTGCGSTAKAVTQSAGGKNLDVEGFVMLGKIETANPETVTPQGEMIMGRVKYKSRRVGIPADQKVPTTGNFRAVKSKGIFGVEETLIEYDFTAGSDKDAKAALEELEKRKKTAQEAFDKKTEK